MSRPEVYPSEQVANHTCGWLFLGWIFVVATIFGLVCCASGCSSTADDHLRRAAAIADGGARVVAEEKNPAKHRAIYHRLRRAIWVQMVLRDLGQPEDPALRAEIEQLRAKALAAEDETP